MEFLIFFPFILKKKIFSEESPKGSDCYDAFKTMQECFAKYPSVYNKTDDDDNDDFENVISNSESELKSTSTTDTNNVNDVDTAEVSDEMKSLTVQSSK